MEKQTRVIVAGDVTIDWLMYPVEAKKEGKNFELFSSYHYHAMEGGALQLAKFIQLNFSHHDIAIDISMPKLPGNIREIPPEQVIHSNVILKITKKENDCKTLYVEKAAGYMGFESERLTMMAPEPNTVLANLIFLDDAGNGFRDNPDSWPKALEDASQPWTLLKMSRPLAEGRLWQKLTSTRRNLIAILNAKDIRIMPGVQVSKSLSWERTAKELLYQLQMAPALIQLRKCPYLIILFETDGAMIVYNDEPLKAVLIYDPKQQEGGYIMRQTGIIIGLANFFTAALAANIALYDIDRLEVGVMEGLQQMRNLVALGYHLQQGRLTLPAEAALKSAGGTSFNSCHVPSDRDLHDPDPCFWRILEQSTRNTRLLVANELALSGQSPVLNRVPAGIFGALTTYDRAEIEQFSAIRELVQEYLQNPKPEHPLSFAVFGPPGSGKSWGVKQLVKTLFREDITITVYNISQFSGYDDLVAAFHKIRDIGLGGNVPFIFWDEFDSDKDGQPLGWLKYFLSPMQDGIFRDGETDYHLGRAIFVFAGGTKDSFGAFNIIDRIARQSSEKSPADEKNESKDIEETTFRQVKVPDFISRLRGFINVMGPNRQQRSLCNHSPAADSIATTPQTPIPWDYDDAFIIRRAQLFYNLIKCNPNSDGLFDSDRRLRIDAGVVRAFLHTTRYRHGARSMSAIIDMSRIHGKRTYDPSALPVKDQLDIHVDAEEFLFLSKKPCFVVLLRLQDLPQPEKTLIENEQQLVLSIAEEIHRYYCLQSQARGQVTASQKSFEELVDDKKLCNIDAAEDIPRKLELTGCALRKTQPGAEAQTPDITDEEVLLLARTEHDRWCWERRTLGWTIGAKHDETNKTTPYLIPFDELEYDIQLNDIEAIYALPVILSRQGLEIYRMIEVDEFVDEKYLADLARIIHEQYIENRKKEGYSEKSDPSMVPFDQLHPDKRAANIDAARDIPKKLSCIGYRLRKCKRNEKAPVLTLTKKQIQALARKEHERWVWQKRLQGWIYAEGKKNEKRKTSPYLIPWDHLPESIRKRDREQVRLIPELLQRAGFAAEKR